MRYGDESALYELRLLNYTQSYIINQFKFDFLFFLEYNSSVILTWAHRL